MSSTPLRSMMTSGLGGKTARAIRSRVRDMPGGFGPTSRMSDAPINRPNSSQLLDNIRSSHAARRVETPPPPITTPIPRARTQLVRRPSSINQPVNSSMSAGITGGMMMTGMGIGGAAGAVSGATYGNREGSLQGAMSGGIRGALAGAIGGAAMGVGAPAMMRAATTHAKFGSTMGGWGEGLTAISKGMNTSEGRNAMMAGGGLLAGGIMGSKGKDKRRGFNSNRGSQISSR